MSVGELQIKADTTQAVAATQKLQESFEILMKKMEEGMKKQEAAAAASGTKWTEFSSVIGLAKGAIGGLAGAFDEYSERVKIASILSQQMTRIQSDDLTKLREMTGDLIAPDKIIAMETLFRKYNITTEQTGNVLKGIIAISREQGKDASELAGNITEGIISGSRDVLENYGIMVTAMTDKDKQRVAILDQFKSKYGEMQVASEGLAESDAARHNAKSVQDARSLKGMEAQIGAIKSITSHLKKVKDEGLLYLATGMNSVENAIASLERTVDSSGTAVWANQAKILQANRDLESSQMMLNEGFLTSKQHEENIVEINNKKLLVYKSQIDELTKQRAAQQDLIRYAEENGYSTAKYSKELLRVNRELWTARKEMGMLAATTQYGVDQAEKLAVAFEKVGRNFAGNLLSRIPFLQSLADKIDPMGAGTHAIEAAKELNKHAENKKSLDEITLDLIKKQNDERKKAVDLADQLHGKQMGRETEYWNKNRANYELQGQYLNEKNRLEKVYNEEVAKGKDADFFKLEALQGQALKLKEKTEWQDKFNIKVGEQNNLFNYQQFITDETILNNIQKERLNIQIALKNNDPLSAKNAQERLVALQQQGEALGQFNVKMKEWETSSYGAMGALSNVWKASADAFLMTDAQLRKAGKTRTQVIKEALQGQILALGKQNLFEGGTNLAKGFAALAMGSPAAAGFFKASAVHFLVAGAAGVGNSLFGSGKSGAKNDTADKNTAPTTSLKTSESQQKNYTIIIPGGVVVNRDDMARNVQAAIGDARGRGWAS